MEREAIATYKKGNQTLKVYRDEDPSDPREWDNIGKMVCFHRKYSLGDKHDLKAESFRSMEEIREYIKTDLKAVVILPLYLYDHSGLVMSVGRECPFNCPWDSMQVGFVYATKQDLKREKLTLEQVKEGLVNEVKTYSQYLNGDVIGYEITTTKTCKTCNHSEEEVIDSCWGFYGSDIKDILDDLPDKGKGFILEAV